MAETGPRVFDDCCCNSLNNIGIAGLGCPSFKVKRVVATTLGDLIDVVITGLDASFHFLSFVLARCGS